ncbi:MAG: alpha-glucosidase, partial [Lachnospiraceae bacterium]|nr:alpha-glucosidase [Lachnospiraceae bacterium]
MIKRYIFGNPIETDAVLSKPEVCAWSNDRLCFRENALECGLKEDEIVYGLGQNVRGINKRGWIYESNCTDDPQHTESKHSLYGAHNFVLLDGEKKLGIFVDTPSKVVFDIGYTDHNRMRITPQRPDFELYLIEEESLSGIIKEFRRLIGRSYIPPRWAFGYGQSRWGYRSAEDIRQVVKNYRDNRIPIDSVYLDIDYMERYKDFTVNEETFPDFEKFVAEMKGQGIHLVPIIDGGVKEEAGYDVYEEGREKGYFCKDEDGKDFVLGVWP